MKFKDLGWIGCLLAIGLIFLFPSSKTWFETATASHPYAMGFLKTSILATMGELLVARIKTGKYFNVLGLGYKWFVWGVLGMVFALVFPLFSGGVSSLKESGLIPRLPSYSLDVTMTAFLTSVLMNAIFAPSFMILHRITDTFIEKGNGVFRQIIRVSFPDVIESIDWKRFFGFVVLKTIPFFWIPAHTITFLLPGTYRVLMASALSIVLGVLLTIAKSKKNKQF